MPELVAVDTLKGGDDIQRDLQAQAVCQGEIHEVQQSEVQSLAPGSCSANWGMKGYSTALLKKA